LSEATLAPAPPEGAADRTLDDDARHRSSGSNTRSVRDLTETAAGGLRWMSMSRIGTEVILFMAMVALARLISPADFGAYSVALIVGGLAWGIPTEGVGTALVQRDVVTREHLQTGGVLTLAAAAVCTVATVSLSYLVVDPLIGHEAAYLVRLSSPMFLLTSSSTVSMALLRRRLDFRRLAIMEIGGNGARAGVSLGLAVAGLGGTALVVGGLAATLVMTIIAIAAVPPPRPAFHRRAAGDLMGYGGPASMATIAWAAFANGDYAVIAARLGTVAAGQYWRAYSLAVGYQTKISVLMSTVAFPVLARSANDEDMLALRSRTVRLMTMVLFPLLTGLAITAPVVVPAVFGHTWTAAIAPTQVLCIGGAATLVIDATGAAFMAMGRARALLVYGLAHFAIYIGSVLIVAGYGITAVAIDAAVVHSLFVLVAYVMMLQGRPQRPLATLWGDIAPAGVGCLGMAALALPADRLAISAGVPGAGQFLVVTIAGGAGYLTCLRIGFVDAWTDLTALLRRLLPGRLARRSRPAGPAPAAPQQKPTPTEGVG
jgi:PST family polysaccharide transporter